MGDRPNNGDDVKEGRKEGGKEGRKGRSIRSPSFVFQIGRGPKGIRSLLAERHTECSNTSHHKWGKLEKL